VPAACFVTPPCQSAAGKNLAMRTRFTFVVISAAQVLLAPALPACLSDRPQSF